MKIFQVAKFYTREDYGKEYCLTLFFNEHHALLQVAFDIGEYGKWFEFPYLQVSFGNGRLFSLLFTISKIGISIDLFGRNWRDELFYIQPNNLKDVE